MLSCAKRPHEFMHLKPQSMQDITPLLKKSALLYYLPIPLVPFSQSFDCIFPTEALNVVFKYHEFEQAPIEVNWQSVRGVPSRISKSLWHVELHLKGRDLFERRQNVNRVVSDKEALCFKNVKPHWTVLYQVIKKWETLRHLLELRPKRKE